MSLTARLMDETGKQVVDIKADAKTFSSGKSGFWGQQRLTMNGKNYQAQVQAVEIVKK